MLEHFAATSPVALDIAPAMLHQARLLWAGRRPPLACVAGDAASPPFAPGSFDLVVVMNAPPEPEAVREMLVPQGRAVFAYSLPYTPVVRPHIRRRLAKAGFALTTVRPSGLGVLVIARRAGAPEPRTRLGSP
ncbi:MAG: class I SAM-dependent methyltransferase [Nitrospinota bacterium]